MGEIVYVLTNSAMPGMVKIGSTSQQDAKDRIGQLYTTGVPVPFDLEFAAEVDDAVKVEKALHIAFAPGRVNPKREFFRTDPEQAIAILRLLQKEDATTEVEQQPETVDATSIEAGKELKRRRPNMNFEEMKIPMGATLEFVEGGTTVVVVGPKRAKLGDEELSLTAATREVSKFEYDVSPTFYWTYNGKLLRDIYDDTYKFVEG